VSPGRADTLRITFLGSGAYEASIKGTGEGYIGSPLNQSAAVGKESDGVRGALETEEEVVEADVAVGSEAVAHGSEVYRTMMLMYLDGVTTAERDVRPAFAG
jgi:hypothetical protein